MATCYIYVPTRTLYSPASKRDLRYDFDVFLAVEDVVDQFVEDDFLQKTDAVNLGTIGLALDSIECVTGL